MYTDNDDNGQSDPSVLPMVGMRNKITIQINIGVLMDGKNTFIHDNYQVHMAHVK